MPDDAEQRSDSEEPAARERREAADALCQRCAACCDGRLFLQVRLSPQEVRQLEGRRLPIADEGEPVLGQPCAALSGSLCSVYEQRPAGCRAFDCRTRRALLDGEIDAAEAGERVERLEELFGRVWRGVQNDTGAEVPPWRRIREHIEAAGARMGPEDLAWLLDVKELRMIIAEAFLDESKHRLP